jgi:light-regulated signal transduction histidine kinase (bacteriophytochrome)
MDDGSGVPPQHRDKIFNAYERGEAPSGLAPSLGLGLHISRFLAERMGGDLTYRYDDQSTWSSGSPGSPERGIIVSASGCGRTSQPHRQVQLPEW